MTYRGIVHFHSQDSMDSINRIEQIVNMAMKNNINFLILSDHNTIKGAKKLQDYVHRNNINIKIIIAAEYKTTLGDIIALNICEEIKNMNFDDFILEVKKQNGKILFPHPYKDHKDIDKIAKHSDMIEIFNSRINYEKNKKAYILSKKYNLNTYGSPDAHVLSELLNCIIEFRGNDDIVDSFLKNEIKIINKNYTLKRNIIYSQIIKGIKRKKTILLFKQIINLLILTINFKYGDTIDEDKIL